MPERLRNIWNTAPPKVACPDGYEGNGGVKSGPARLLAGAPSGVNVGSPTVNGLPSPSPLGPVPGSDSRMPVIGRQNF